MWKVLTSVPVSQKNLINELEKLINKIKPEKVWHQIIKSLSTLHSVCLFSQMNSKMLRPALIQNPVRYPIINFLIQSGIQTSLTLCCVSRI